MYIFSLYFSLCTLFLILIQSSFMCRYSMIEDCIFIDTDLYEYRFIDCEQKNNVVRTSVPGCQLDFDYNIHYKEVFQENLIGQLTIIPGTLITSLLMDRIGRVKIMSESAGFSFFYFSLDFVE